MARETKFGLLFVVVLTGVFGMLVYKKLHSPLGLVAGTNSEAAPAETPPALPASNNTAPTPLLDAASSLAQANNSLTPTPSPSKSTPQRPVSPATVAANPFNTQLPAATPQAAATQPKPKLPTAIDDEFFAPPAAPTTGTNATNLEPEFVEASSAAESMSTAARTSDPFDFEPAATTATAQPQAAPTAESVEAFDPFADTPPTSGSPATSTVAIPDDVPAAALPESDPFMETASAAPAVTETATLEVPAAATPATVESDPFGDSTAQPQGTAQSPRTMAVETFPIEEPAPAAPLMEAPRPVQDRGASNETTEFQPAQALPADDPFLTPEPPQALSTPVRGSGSNSRPVEFAPPAAAEVPLSVPQEPRRVELPPTSTPAMSAPRTVAPPVEPDPFGDTTPEVELPAQPSVPLPKVDPPQPMRVTTARAPSPAPRPAVSAGTYVVQPGDDFWKISKQVYGTGRYFQALAKHNAATVADPGKMQPGTRVTTPPVQQLEALYRAEVPLGEAPGVQALRQNHPDRYAPDAQPGFFIDAAGQPMYRIGSSDTLSTIARNHLGRSSRWQQIFAMNRDILKDGNTLSVGAILKLPADASQVQMIGFDKQNR